MGASLGSAQQAREGAFGLSRRSPDWLWAAAVALALAFIARQIVISGSWLDEYWQLWISGASADVLPSRLLNDAHPPWFNLLARPIVLATGGALVPSRLINLMAALAVLGGGLWSMAGLDRALRWRMLLLLVASAGAVGMAYLALSFRVYVWLLVLAALQCAVLTALVLKRPVPTLVAVLATAASVAVHYVHAAGAIAIAVVSLAVAWRVDRPAFRAILVGLGAGVALDLATGLAQLSHWREIYDVNWIAESGGGAARSLASVAVAFAGWNGVAAALIAVALIARRSKALLVVLAPVPLAFVGWLILDTAAPMVVPRYMASLTALLTTGAALAWWELALAPPVNAVVALLAALQPLAGAVFGPPVAGWEAGARIAAAVTARCPSARLYAVSPWRFRDHRGSKAERFEDPVVEFGYRRVGQAYGLSPQFVSGQTTLSLGHCPAIVWIEAAHGIESVAPDSILSHAGLRLPARAIAKVIPTPNGAVLLISPVDRLQPRP